MKSIHETARCDEHQRQPSNAAVDRFASQGLALVHLPFSWRPKTNLWRHRTRPRPEAAMLLRVAVTAAALLTAFAYQRTKTFSVWIGLFFVIAAAFNPIVPLHLTRGAWSILNIAAGALFVGQFVVDRHRGKQKDGICTKAE